MNKKTAPVIEPLFQFNKQCEEAIELYTKAFGAKLTYLGRYGNADPKDLPPKYNEEDADLIFHAQMMIGNQRILMADNLFNDLPMGHTVFPVMTFETADDVKAALNILLDGATIVNPLSSTTYCTCCVSLIDKFGVYWDLMAE